MMRWNKRLCARKIQLNVLSILEYLIDHQFNSPANILKWKDLDEILNEADFTQVTVLIMINVIRGNLSWRVTKDNVVLIKIQEVF